MPTPKSRNQPLSMSFRKLDFLHPLFKYKTKQLATCHLEKKMRAAFSSVVIRCDIVKNIVSLPTGIIFRLGFRC